MSETINKRRLVRGYSYTEMREVVAKAGKCGTCEACNWSFEVLLAEARADPGRPYTGRLICLSCFNRAIEDLAPRR